MAAAREAAGMAAAARVAEGMGGVALAMERMEAAEAVAADWAARSAEAEAKQAC